MSASPTPQLPPVGTLVGGKYHLERYIAEGGMGVIAVARHVELDEPVALKFLKPGIVSGDPTVASRFVREARATIKIRSEHVPRIFDVTTLDIGVPYIVMELLEGEDLDKCLERQRELPIAFVVDLLLQSLEALAAAHALGMVHRDFKPANLFVARRLDGTNCVKVLDFGIAKLVDQNGTGGDHGLTGTAAVMGSPRYMSPEQMRSARDVDGRADIWAVGTTLYELLTGVAPFDGESLTQVCAAILQDEPLPMAIRRPEVPAELEAVVRRCLAKRPPDRYSNVAELAAALAPFGTAPAAYEMASRVARVLGTPAANLPSDPALVASSLSLASSSPALVSSSPALVARQVQATPSSPSIGATNTSWGAVNASSRSGRRWTWAIASVFAVLFVAGAVLGGVALVRSKGAEAGRPNASSTGGAATNAPAPPSNNPPAAPVTVEPASLSTSAAVLASASPTGSAGVAAASSTRPQTQTSTGADPRPASAPAPRAPTTAKSATKPTPAPSGGLWDDRK